MPGIRSCIAAALAALAWIAGPAAAEDEGIVVYTSQHAALTQAWADAFTAETGVPVSIRKGTDTVMANQIIQEGAYSPADVFLTENSPAMVLVENAGLFAPVDPATLEQVPGGVPPGERHVDRDRRSDHGLRLQHRAAGRGRPAGLDARPRPRRNGRAAGARPRRGPTSRRSSRRCCCLRGPDETAAWLTGLKQNALAYRGNFEAMRGANLGEVEGALIYQYYYFGDRNGTGESSDKVELHYFGDEDPGAFVSVSGGGVLASSSHPEQAQAFLAYVTGPEGQAILRDGTSFEYPVGSGVEANPAMRPLSRARLSQGRSLAARTPPRSSR